MLNSATGKAVILIADEDEMNREFLAEILSADDKSKRFEGSTNPFSYDRADLRHSFVSETRGPSDADVRSDGDGSFRTHVS
jgi:hypothetical protein